MAGARCVGPDRDPCNGLDDDGNGIVDDPESCWASVFTYLGPGQARCFGLSPLSPPPGCAGYTLADREPSFALPATPVPGTSAVRQCSHGDEHVVLSEAMAPDTSREAYEALGFDCRTTLGFAWTMRPALEAPPAVGTPCALARHATAAALGAGQWRFTLGAEAPPAGATCDPTGTLWVLSDATACMTEAEPCALADCPIRPSGSLVSQRFSSGAVLEPETVIKQRYVFLNDGPLPWLSHWRVLRTEGRHSFTGVLPLGREIAVGQGFELEFEIGIPASGLDLVEVWRIEADDFYTFLPVRFEFDVAAEHAAHLVSILPSADTELPPRRTLELQVELENSGFTTWPAGTRLVREDEAFTEASALTVGALGPGERTRIAIAARTPDAFGEHVERWSLVDAAGDPVPIDGARYITLVLRVIGEYRAHLLAESHRADTHLPPGTPFIKWFRLENRGRVEWTDRWTLRPSALSDLEAAVETVRPVGLVLSGESFLFAIPMRVPRAPAHELFEEGWSFYDDRGGIVSISRTVDGAERLTSSRGAWLWTGIVATVPCRP